MDLAGLKTLIIKQVFEGWELLGYETRNKYAITTEDGESIGFAAEQQKGVLGWLMRQYLGHWRKYDVHFFDKDRNEIMLAHHPFRFIFQEFQISDGNGKSIGSLKQRFAFFTKRFDVLDANGSVILEVSSPIWKIWTFPFTQKGAEVARVEKKWSGLLTEGFTDKDTFRVVYDSDFLTNEQRMLLLASSVFIDLQYFEKKAR